MAVSRKYADVIHGFGTFGAKDPLKTTDENARLRAEHEKQEHAKLGRGFTSTSTAETT